MSSACFTASCTTTRLSWERWMAVAVETTSRVRRLTTSASRPRTPSRRRMLAAAVDLELVVQRLEADAEHVGGARLVVAVGREGLQDQGLLGVLQARPHPEAHPVGPVTQIGHAQGRRRGNVLGEDGDRKSTRLNSSHL